MDSYQASMCKIMQAALPLFRQYGYKKTGIRQIADASGVSLGLVNHYFISKRLLAQQALSLLLSYVTQQVKNHIDIKQDPVLFDATATRVQLHYLLSGEFRQFYLDALEEGIYFDSMMAYPDEILVNLSKEYDFSDSDDYILLYNRFLPCDLEKILVLGKENGQFPTISYDEIPFLICRTAKEQFVPIERILQADQASRPLAKAVGKALPATPSEEFIQAYICALAIPTK